MTQAGPPGGARRRAAPGRPRPIARSRAVTCQCPAGPGLPLAVPVTTSNSEAGCVHRDSARTVPRAWAAAAKPGPRPGRGCCQGSHEPESRSAGPGLTRSGGPSRSNSSSSCHSSCRRRTRDVTPGPGTGSPPAPSRAKVAQPY